MRGELEPTAAHDSAEETLDLHRVMAVLLRRKVSIALGFVIALVPILLLTLTSPDQYEAIAKVAIQGTPKVMQLGPDYMPPEPRRSSDPVLALVGSDAVLGRVADQLPPTPEEPTGSSTLGTVRRWLGEQGSTRPLTPAQERQQRIAWIRKSMESQLVGGGTILEISYTIGQSDFAAAMANAVAKEFVEYRLSERDAALRRATGWLGQRVLEVRGQIERGEDTIADLVAREGITPAGAESPEDDVRADLMDQLRAARIELLTAKQRLDELEPRAQEQKLRVADEDRRLLAQQYAEDKAALARAKLLYTPTHPEVARLEATVSNLQDRLESEFPSSNARASGEDALSEYHLLQGDRSRLEARAAVLERTLDKLGLSDQPSSQARVAYDRLRREVAINREVLGILLRRRNETMLAAATEGSEARILDPAIAPVAPIGPNRFKWLILGIAVALGSGGGLGLLRELLDRKVRDPERVAEILGLQALGVIPRVHDGSAPELQGTAESNSVVAESYRLLRTTLLFSQRGSRERRPGSELGTLVVTSGVAGEGKTTVATNLAQSFASAGRNVLLVDGDLRRPRIDRVTGAERAPGLAEVLRDSVPVHKFVQAPPGRDFHVLTSGEIPMNPSELLDPSRLETLFEEFKAQYDLVVIDSPVLLSVPDALLLAAHADGTLLVHRPNSLDQSGLSQIRSDLDRAEARVLGIVFSQVKRKDRQVYPRYLESPYSQAGTA